MRSLPFLAVSRLLALLCVFLPLFACSATGPSSQGGSEASNKAGATNGQAASQGGTEVESPVPPGEYLSTDEGAVSAKEEKASNSEPVVAGEAVPDGEIRIRPLAVEGPVYTGFQSFSAVSAFNKHPETRRFLGEDPEGVALVQGLHPAAIRFPGGSFAAKFNPQDEKGERITKAYLELVRTSGVSDCILVLNLFKGTIGQAEYLVRKLQAGGVQIVAVELGNEYHLKKYRDKYPTADPYVAEAARYIDALKPLLPGVPYGIPVPSSRHVFDAEQFGNRAEFFETWTNTLADAVQSGRLPVQAVIPHFYKQTHEVYDLPTHERRFDGVMDALRIDSYGFLDRVVLNYYQEEFGDVAVWITEWGLKEKQVYGNTLAEGIHVTGFLLDMLEANQRTGNRVAHSAYQKMAGPVCIGAITPKGTLQTMEAAENFQPGTAWYAFHDLGEAITDAQYVRSEIRGPGQDAVRMATFRRGESLYIVFANRTGQSYRMDIAGRMTAVWGDKAWASNGQTFWNDTGNGRAKYLPAQRMADQLGNVIPPYGYGYLKANWDAVMQR